MSRYRKVAVRMWSDAKFRRLSPLQPSGQALWLYLLTGPHTGIIPGLFRATEAGMAEELGWDLEAFRHALAEAMGEGLVHADLGSKLWWLPNAVAHNKPESLNVVIGWGREFDLLPECDLKDEAKEAMRADVSSISEAYAKAYAKAFGKPSRKASPKARAIQEQEQEQEQENKHPLPPPSGPAPASRPVAMAPGVCAEVQPLDDAKPEPEPAEPDANGERPAADGPRTLFAGSDVGSEGSAPKTATTDPKQRTASACPGSDASDADMTAWCARWKLDPSHPEFPQWLDHHRAKRSLFADWAAAWRTWQRNAAKWQRGAPAATAFRPGIQPSAAPGDSRWTPGDGSDWLEDGQ